MCMNLPATRFKIYCWLALTVCLRLLGPAEKHRCQNVNKLAAKVWISPSPKQNTSQKHGFSNTSLSEKIRNIFHMDPNEHCIKHGLNCTSTSLLMIWSHAKLKSKQNFPQGWLENPTNTCRKIDAIRDQINMWTNPHICSAIKGLSSAWGGIVRPCGKNCTAIIWNPWLFCFSLRATSNNS